MRLNTFTVPLCHFQQLDHGVAFRHMWQGSELYWIVPEAYVISLRLVDGKMRIRLDDYYWTRGVNQAAA